MKLEIRISKSQSGTVARPRASSSHLNLAHSPHARSQSARTLTVRTHTHSPQPRSQSTRTLTVRNHTHSPHPRSRATLGHKQPASLSHRKSRFEFRSSNFIRISDFVLRALSGLFDKNLHRSPHFELRSSNFIRILEFVLRASSGLFDKNLHRSPPFEFRPSNFIRILNFVLRTSYPPSLHQMFRNLTGLPWSWRCSAPGSGPSPETPPGVIFVSSRSL